MKFGIYFGGRKDKSVILVKEGERLNRETIIENVDLVSEPSSIYLGHVSPVSGSTYNIQRSILAFLVNVDLTKLQTVGCDGLLIQHDLKMTSVENLSLFKERHMQHVVCLIHTIEPHR